MAFKDKFETTYKKMLFTRQDENECLYYFSSNDFDGLNKKEITVKKPAISDKVSNNKTEIANTEVSVLKNETAQVYHRRIFSREQRRHNKSG